MNRFQVCLACWLMVSCGGGQAPAPNTAAAPAAQSQTAAAPGATLDASSEKSFTGWATARLAELRPNWTIGAGPDELTLLVTIGETQLALGLGRMWEYCQSGAADCEATVRGYLEQAVTSVDQLATPSKPDPAQLVVAIRSKAAVDAYRAQAPDLLTEQIADDVFVVYMFDSPTMAKGATERDLKELGLDAKKVRTRALENMQAQLGKPEDHVKDLEAGQLGTFPSGFYTSSLLYPHQAWAKVAKRFGGKLLVSVPSNDMLLYADGRHAQAELALTALTVRTFQEAERGVSPYVFKWTPKGWVAQTK
jgi:uncharacterized protein YtpQ (UPF0354 family)